MDAPGEQATDGAGQPREDDPAVPNTGGGVGVADRGQVELTKAPTARLSVSVRAGSPTAGWPITADASASTPGWSTPVTYVFDFGDGTASSQKTPVAQHVYPRAGNYTVAVRESNADGLNSSSAGSTQQQIVVGDRFVPVAPVRMLDTRSAIGVSTSTPVPASSTVVLPVTGKNGIPANVTAVVLNVTVTAQTELGYLTAYPDGQPRPVSSNLDWAAGQTVANMVILPVVDGKVDFYNGSAGTVRLIADLAGYYTSDGGDAYSTMTPARVLDTRAALGVPTTTPVAAGGTVVLSVAGGNGVPDDATAVVLNVTVADPTDLGYLTVYPDGQSRPVVSNVDWAAGQTVPNLVIVPVVNGKVDFYNGSAGTVRLIADAFGYYSPERGGEYNAVTPTRVLDTRKAIGVAGTTPVGPLGVVPVSLAKVPGAPATGVTSVVVNVTVTAQTSGGYLVASDSQCCISAVSNLNWITGETVANLVVVPVVNGTAWLHSESTGKEHIIADVLGYYTY